MLSRDQLADLLRSIPVQLLHEASGVSVKTIYRLRNKQNAPNFDTVERLIAAADGLRACALNKLEVRDAA